ncbi:TauD/TfdA dioxygenase family protein [Rhodovibrionaceae bacterium A322]
MSLEIHPLTPTLGAEIHGADLSRDDHFEEIYQAFIDYSVIAIHDQKLSPEDHLAFARRWGEINVNRFFKPVQGYPEIATVLKEADQTSAIGEDWHTDHSYDQIPALCSILYAIETPMVGGDTAFASMNAAYQALSEGFQSTLKGLAAWHSSRHAFGETQADSEAHQDGRLENTQAATQDALHPVVIQHPLSGKPCIYVNADFTVRFDGWTEAESAPLLQQLFQHCRQAQFTCRLRWKPGMLAMWDNRATWHKAINDYPGQRRLMHRITVEGVPLTGWS